jgi:hypothetical protein
VWNIHIGPSEGINIALKRSKIDPVLLGSENSVSSSQKRFSVLANILDPELHNADAFPIALYLLAATKSNVNYVSGAITHLSPFECQFLEDE